MKKNGVITIISLVLCLGILLSGCRTGKDRENMHLSNENADATTAALYDYICDIYEENILTGQQESTWMGSTEYEMDIIEKASGKLPAIRGLDFMNDDFDGVVDRSIDWWNRGGIVTICWHCGPDFSGNYDNCKNDEITDWEKVLTKGTPENRAFITNMDKAGNALLKLQEAGVPVLWRPFHEFDGAWFWWGKGGSEHFKRLWIMMYDHFTNDLGLNNLIWVLGYSHNGTDYGGRPIDWYPGDQYCDIIGADSYEVDENGAEERLHILVDSLTYGRKPLIFHECGKIPTIEQMQGTPWCAFMAWHTEWLTETNTDDELNTIYNSDYAITLDELPDFTEYAK